MTVKNERRKRWFYDGYVLWKGGKTEIFDLRLINLKYKILKIMEEKEMKKLISLFLALITILTISTPMTISAEEALTGTALLEDLGLSPLARGGVQTVASATRDAAGCLVVKAGSEATANTEINLYLSANLPDEVKGLSSYTIEAKVMPIEKGRNEQMGISLNTDNTTAITNMFGHAILAYNAGAATGQVLCRRIVGLYGSSTLGTGTLEAMSAAWNSENVLSMRYDGSTKGLTYSVNGVDLTSETVSKEFSLSSFNIVIPANATIGISYMRVYDGSGKLVYDNTFIEDIDPNLPTSVGMKALSRGGVQTVAYAKRDDAGRLIVKAGPETATEQINLYLSANLPNEVKGLSNYTVEAKIAPVAIGRNAQMGISLNTDNETVVTNMFGHAILAYNAGAVTGQVLCRRITGGVAGGLAFGSGNLANMSAAWNSENVFSMSYNGSTKGLTYGINGVDLVTETVSGEFSLSSFSIVIPASAVIAISYMKVYDGDGNLVYNNTFSDDASNDIFAPDNPTDAIAFRGIQKKLGTDDDFAIRFVAAVNGLDYENIGFDVTVSYGNGLTKTVSKEITSVYESITATTEEGASIEYTAAELNGEYLAVYTISEIPAVTDGKDVVSISVSVFYTPENGEKTSVGDIYEFVFKNGGFASSSTVSAGN